MVDKPQAAEGKGEDKIDALIARLDAQDKEISRLREQNLSLLSQPAPAQHTHVTAPALPEEPELDMTGMPDPATDPDKYNAELARRLKSHSSAIREYEKALSRANAAAAQDTGPQIDENRLWELYKEEHPLYAEKTARVRTAVSMAMDDMKKRGIDPTAVMARSPEDFFTKVNAVYDKEFGAPEEKKPDPKPSEGDDDGRTAGFFGGQAEGGKPSQPANQEQEGGNFTKELKEFQDKMWANPGTPGSA